MNVTAKQDTPLTDRIKLLDMEARIEWWVEQARLAAAVVSEDAARVAA
jgi:hypothetical protein